jgi:hypothetical protein
MHLMEIVKLKDEGRLSSPDYSESDLRGMIKVCEPQEAGTMGLLATQTIKAIRDELERRAVVQRHQEAITLANRLEQQVGKLLDVATAQKVLAGKLDRQTTTLIDLTRALKVFTAVLVILTAGLVVKDGCHFFEGKTPIAGHPNAPPAP